MTEREALKLALEALDGTEALLSSMDVTHLLIYGEVEKAITAIREALAEQPAQQQEPEFFTHSVEQPYDWSEWVCPDPKGYLMKCCDCGLVHEVQFDVVRYKSKTEREDCEPVNDPNLQAVFRMRRNEQWSPADTAHRAGGLPMEQPAQPKGCQCPACKIAPHASDCPVHNEPAWPNGPCDCGAQPEQEYKRGYADAMNWKVQNHLEHLPVAQPEQEPAKYKFSIGCRACGHLESYDMEVNGLTTPPQRKPLTDEQKDAARWRFLVDNSFDKKGVTQFHIWEHSWEPHSQTGEPTEWKQRLRGPALDRFIDRAIEAAHGIKGEA